MKSISSVVNQSSNIKFCLFLENGECIDILSNKDVLNCCILQNLANFLDL